MASREDSKGRISDSGIGLLSIGGALWESLFGIPYTSSRLLLAQIIAHFLILPPKSDHKS